MTGSYGRLSGGCVVASIPGEAMEAVIGKRQKIKHTLAELLQSRSLDELRVRTARSS
jgi:hypothetical protein